ncbi:hypothetical protein BMETH_2027_0 [methanotrophic bacterial endosymbiont of Bathymodiolus sp.]|nr:hypothetical protein BMETH_2027_0 [methanotrophic bacterial endosymbiont of Bathymodiolus sp.]
MWRDKPDNRWLRLPEATIVYSSLQPTSFLKEHCRNQRQFHLNRQKQSQHNNMIRQPDVPLRRTIRRQHSLRL